VESETVHLVHTSGKKRLRSCSAFTNVLKSFIKKDPICNVPLTNAQKTSVYWKKVFVLMFLGF